MRPSAAYVVLPQVKFEYKPPVSGPLPQGPVKVLAEFDDWKPITMHLSKSSGAYELDRMVLCRATPHQSKPRTGVSDAAGVLVLFCVV